VLFNATLLIQTHLGHYQYTVSKPTVRANIVLVHSNFYKTVHCVTTEKLGTFCLFYLKTFVNLQIFW
jgi:hypothetical protein